MMPRLFHLISRMQTTPVLAGICITAAALCGGCGEPICKRKLTCVDDSGVGGSGGGQGGGGGGGAGQGGMGGEATISLQMERLAADNTRTCVVARSGEAFCWGSSAVGALGNGDGTTTTYTTATQVLGITDAVEVDGACVRLEDGGVRCWGSNGFGQVGVGDKVTYLTPQIVDIDNVVGIRHGVNFVCALSLNGQVYCWGRNDFGQLGSGSSAAEVLQPELASITGVAQLFRGVGALTYARLGGGELWTWPLAPGQEPGQTSVFFNPMQLESGNDGPLQPACAVSADNKVYCWGTNDSGQLGDGTNVDSAMPVEVSMLDDAVAISAGLKFRCALRASGTVACWGINDYGQLGDGTTANASTPREVQGLHSVAAISAGYRHACALRMDETVWCWGINYYGQLGNGTTDDSSVPVMVQGLPEPY